MPLQDLLSGAFGSLSDEFRGNPVVSPSFAGDPTEEQAELGDTIGGFRRRRAETIMANVDSIPKDRKPHERFMGPSPYWDLKRMSLLARMRNLPRGERASDIYSSMPTEDREQVFQDAQNELQAHNEAHEIEKVRLAPYVRRWENEKPEDWGSLTEKQREDAEIEYAKKQYFNQYRGDPESAAYRFWAARVGGAIGEATTEVGATLLEAASPVWEAFSKAAYATGYPITAEQHDKFSTTAANWRRAIEKSRQYREAWQKESWLPEGSRISENGLSMMAEFAGLTQAAGWPGYLTTIGTSAYQEALAEGEEAGFDDGSNAAQAAARALSEVGPVLLMQKLGFGGFERGKDIIKVGLARAWGEEFIEESGVATLQQTIRKVTGLEKRPLGEVLLESLEEVAKLTGFMTGAMRGPAHASDVVFQPREGRRKARWLWLRREMQRATEDVDAAQEDGDKPAAPDVIEQLKEKGDTRSGFTEAIEGDEGLKGLEARSKREREALVEELKNLDAAKEALGDNVDAFDMGTIDAAAKAMDRAAPGLRKTLGMFKKHYPNIATPELDAAIYEFAHNDPVRMSLVIGALDAQFAADGGKGKKWTPERVEAALRVAKDATDRWGETEIGGEVDTSDVSLDPPEDLEGEVADPDRGVHYGGFPWKFWRRQTPPDIVPGAGDQSPATGKRRYNPDRLPQDIRMDDPLVEERMQESIQDPENTTWQNIVEKVGRFWKSVRRVNLEVPTDAKFAGYNNVLRLLSGAQSGSKRKAQWIVNQMVSDIGPVQAEVMARYLYMRDAAFSYDWAKQNGAPLPQFRFGLPQGDAGYAQAVKERDKHEAYIKTHLADTVGKALKRRSKLVKKIVDQAVDEKLLPERARDHVGDYFHYQIRQHEEARRRGWLSGQVEQYKKGSHKARETGERIAEMDPSLRFYEAEVEWLAETIHALRQNELIRQIEDLSPVKLADLQSEAKAKSQATGGNVAWQDVLRNDYPEYDEFVVPPGHLFYVANTIDQKIAEQLIQATVLDPNAKRSINASDLNTALAVGLDKPPMILPKEVAAELKRLQVEPRTSPGLMREATRLWKERMLLGPDVTVAYGIRNLLGDLEMLLAGRPGSLRYLARAFREVRDFYQGRTLKPSPMLRLAMEHDVPGSGFATFEIGELPTVGQVQHLYEKPSTAKGKGLYGIRWYRNWVQGAHEVREATLRYAVFLNDMAKMKKMRKNGQTFADWNSYGASRPKIIDALAAEMGETAAIAKMARDLIGDYGNISHFGNEIRETLVPFWAFTELNTRRFAQLGMNSMTNPAFGAALAIRLALLQGTLNTFNAIFGGDDDNLSEEDRWSPHIRIRSGGDDRTYVFRRVGASSDIMEMMGLTHAVGLFPQLMEGTIPPDGYAQEVTNAVGESMLNRLGPGAKLVSEAVHLEKADKLMSPELIPPVLDTFGFGQYGKGIAGLFGAPTKAKKGTALRAATGGVLSIVEGRRNSYNNMRMAARRYKKYSLDQKPPGIVGASMYKGAREAARPGDVDEKMFRRWWRKWRKDHPIPLEQAKRNFKQSVSSVVRFVAKKDKLDFAASLTPDQRAELNIAMDYAAEWEANLMELMRNAASEER